MIAPALRRQVGQQARYAYTQLQKCRLIREYQIRIERLKYLGVPANRWKEEIDRLNSNLKPKSQALSFYFTTMFNTLNADYHLHWMTYFLSTDEHPDRSPAFLKTYMTRILITENHAAFLQFNSNVPVLASMQGEFESQEEKVHKPAVRLGLHLLETKQRTEEMQKRMREEYIAIKEAEKNV